MAGLLAATTPARAADLGGDCCADLEERVAELEATTARKGNRRMSLTVSGQVSRSILYWSGPEVSSIAERRGVYAGLDNDSQSTRFVFAGSAKIRPDLTAGFEFMTEWAAGASTRTVDQFSADGGLSADGRLAVRTANWWLEDKHWGRVTVGRLNVGGPVATIDLGGISTAAHNSPRLVGGGFYATTGATSTKLGDVIGPTYGADRIEGVRYDTANLGGFVAQAAWGEDDVGSVSLRYAGEFGGIRVAAGIGYLVQRSSPTQFIQLDTRESNENETDNEWSGSLALMHTASGLFAQGHYARTEFFGGRDAGFWMIQAGITKNWSGLGNTSLYGEYGQAENFIADSNSQSNSHVNFFGLGIVQQIDAAAMEVFIGWRRFETDVRVFSLGAGLFPDGGDLDLIHGGARIRF